MKKFHYYIPIFLQKVGYIVFSVLYKTFLKIEIRGKENFVGLRGPVIIAANHTSELDVTTASMLLPFFSPLLPIYFVSDPKEKFKTFGWRNYIYGGIFFNLLGGYAIHSGHKDYAISLTDHIELLKKGRTVYIFPEGKRTLDGNLSPARGGLGFLAFQSKATVVPVAINTFHALSWKVFLLRKRKVVIDILKPIKADELFITDNPTVDDYRRASQLVMDVIREKIYK
ncbi:MAG: 1-acyl-sn-glycerol-3-phosphate acyltransferase [Parcubacteria bacterium C7867-006]|nr:MAG: 1-acyl-sn-glycerol-3-phosphate acyltransferase [Parcubacteria bacterium C7867-006]